MSKPQLPLAGNKQKLVHTNQQYYDNFFIVIFVREYSVHFNENNSICMCEYKLN